MSKLNQEELLERLDSSFDQEDIFLRGLRYDHDISQESFDKRIEKNTQARKQIKEMIQKPEKDEQLDVQFVELLEEAKRLGIGEKEFIDNILKKYKQKLEVTEEWVEMKAKMFTALAYRLTQHEPHIENHHFNLMEAKNFIHSLVKEIK